MPHSSGGGSHGGGHHGGHHGGSHRSGRSSGGGGSSFGTGHYVSSTHFTGSRRYVRYREHKAEYIYTNYDITDKTYKRCKKIFFVMLGVILVVMAILLAMSCMPPKKMNVDNGKPGIEDTMDLFTDAEELEMMEVLESFKEKTGITPYVMTVANEDWERYYLFNMERYAYEQYVKRFKDEAHWLVMYSEPRDAAESFFNDWRWEGMQGDDTDPIITRAIADKHTQTLHKYLLANTRYTVAEAITESFREIMPDLMKGGVSELTYSELGVMALVLFLLWIFWYAVIVPMKPYDSYYADYVECPYFEAREIVCDYCQGVYVRGTVTSCPHCGAPVKVSTEQEGTKK